MECLLHDKHMHDVSWKMGLLENRSILKGVKYSFIGFFPSAGEISYYGRTSILMRFFCTPSIMRLIIKTSKSLLSIFSNE